jgi:hypothetical protein
LITPSPSADGLSSASRRRLCKIVGAFFLGGAIEGASAAALASPSGEEQATLAAFLDTLLPRDQLSGSATELGVDRQLWAFSNTEPDFRKLVDYGCRWLNMTGSTRFSVLASEQQIAVVDWMSRADWNEIPRRFYELVRQVAIELYYANPAALSGLPISRSPQPLGYPPPWS